MYIGKSPFKDSMTKLIDEENIDIQNDSFYLLVPSFFFEEPSESSKKKNKARFSEDFVDSFKNYICANDLNYN